MRRFYRTIEDFEANIARRQRKLIPLNIVVAILALVAALTIIFSPLITVDFGKSGDLVTEIVQESTDDESLDEEIDTEEIINSVMEVLDFKISLTTYSLLNFSLSDNPVEFISAQVADILNDVTDSLLTGVMISTIANSMSESTDVEISADEAEKVLDTVKELETTSEEDVDATISNIFQTLQDIVGEEVLGADSYDNFCDAMREMYDNTVKNTEDGSFSVEAMISIYVSETMGGEDEEGDDVVVYTSYEELVSGLLNSYLDDADDIIEYAVIGVTALAVMMIFVAAMWGILFLFSFIRIFTRNKRFTMWYVKLFGFWPCLLFWLVPTILPSVLGGVLEESAIVSAVLGMISSTAWISGLCYILLWLISIFWAFPIKRKIRANMRELEA